ncbi:MAG: Ig-like domain-containing protein, partial [Lachnospira sp.]|nr:Ig-like domain-containing protein [Lachnospira sp.]
MDNNYRKKVWIIGIFILAITAALKISSIFDMTQIMAMAAENEQVIIRDAQKAYRENISVELHKTNTSCYAVVTPDTIANKAVIFTSQNPAIMTVSTVVMNGVYYAQMTGVAEGVTKVTATTTSGKTYSSYVTVYTAVPNVTGIINTATPLKKTALPQADNFTKTASINDTGTVKGRVGSYLYLDMPAGYLEKGYHIAYIEKEKVTIKCTGIQLSTTALTLYVNETKQIKRKVLPIVATNRKVSFSSNNKQIAVVSNKGTVRAKKQGTATITCTAADGSGITATCTVTVKQHVKKILVRKANDTLHKGEEKKLTAKITPRTADNKAVIWSSSNAGIVSVNSEGTITAVSTGTATITCAAQDGSGVTGTSRITVESKYKLEIEDIGTITAGDTVTAKARLLTQEGALVKTAVKSGNKASTTIIWSSSNKRIATVDKTTGTIHANYAGRFVLTCKTKDGKTIARKTIKVGDPHQVTNKVFKNIPKEKFYLYEKNKSILLSPNAEGLTWSSSSPNIAQVRDGVVTMKNSGSVLIKCTKNGKKTKVCRLYLYQKATKKYGIHGIQKADFKTGNPRRKISVLGTLGETGIVTVVNKKKAAVASDKVLLYSKRANCDFFFKNWNDIFKGVHFLNQDTLEYNEKEAIVFNIVDDTLYIHINVKFRGDGMYQEFKRQLFYGQEESCGKYKKLVTEGIEDTYTLNKVNFNMTPFPKDLKLKVVTKLNDLTEKKKEKNKNYITIQIGNYKTEDGKVIEPLRKKDGSSYYWYYTTQDFEYIPVMKS